MNFSGSDVDELEDFETEEIPEETGKPDVVGIGSSEVPETSPWDPELPFDPRLFQSIVWRALARASLTCSFIILSATIFEALEFDGEAVGTGSDLLLRLAKASA